MELITTQGYPDYVTTSDGYVLALHRIPGGKDNNKGETEAPILTLFNGRVFFHLKGKETCSVFATWYSVNKRRLGDQSSQ